MRYYDYPTPMHQDYGILEFIMPVVMLLIIAAVIIVAIRLLRGNTTGRHHSMYRDPLDIARERYAKGEITKEQFAELQKDLKV